MFEFVKRSLLITSFIVAAQSHAHGDLLKQVPRLEEAWTVDNISVPESVVEVGHGKNSFFLVSLIDGDPLLKDGQGGIAKISASGELLDKEWVTGLNAPKGLAVYKDWVYVADIDEVVVIDLKTADIVIKIPVPGALLLNDVAVDKKGTLYVSDTFTSQVIRVKNFIPDVYLDNVPAANGLYVQGHDLLVGAGPQLFAFDKRKQLRVVATGFPFELDGVAPAGCGGYFVSSWEGQIYWISATGEKFLLLDTVAQYISTADFAYSENKDLLVVPNFFSNRVTAYKVKK